MKGILIQGQVQKIQTQADESLRITLDTQEPSEEQWSGLFNLKKSLVTVYFAETISSEHIKAVDEADLPEPEMNTKSNSQRLRSVLYCVWEQCTDQSRPFKDWLGAEMNKVIDHYKEKLD